MNIFLEDFNAKLSREDIFKPTIGWWKKFLLGLVTNAIWLLSFDLIILIALHRTMAYASSVHNNTDSVWLKFFILSN
jgi:hypothetical protein